MQILISWLLDLHCLQRQSISGFNRTGVNFLWCDMKWASISLKWLDTDLVCGYDSWNFRWLSTFIFKMSRHMTKPTVKPVWPAKTQISLYSHPVWQGFRFILLWTARRLLNHKWSAKTDQTVQMGRLIWVFAGRTWHFAGFIMGWLKYIILLISFCCRTAWIIHFDQVWHQSMQKDFRNDKYFGTVNENYICMEPTPML